MKSNVTAWIRWSIALALVVVSSLACAQDLYTTPNGTGTACTQRRPCSLASVKQMARMLHPSTIHLGAGTYRLQHPLSFTQQDSGTAWQGPQSGEAILDGGLRLTGWRLYDAKKNIWSAPLPANANALQLYVNGQRALRARRNGCNKSLCAYTPDGLSGGASLLQNVKHPDEVVAVTGVRWRDFHCRIASLAGEAIRMAQPCWNNTVVDSVKNGWSNASPKGKPYTGIDWFENAYEFLGTPGQFYIDSRLHRIFYVPRVGEDMRSADVELPIVEHLLQVDRTPSNPVHDLHFDRMTFQHAGWLYSTTDGYVPLQAGYLITGPHTDLPDNGEGLHRIPAAVEIFGGDHIIFSDNTFQQLGAAGIGFDRGTRDSVIEGSTFRDLSGGAVFIGDTTAAPLHLEDRSSSNIVRHNTIDHVAVEYRDNVGIMGGFNNGLTIDHNTLSNLPYTGISVGWGWDYEGEGDTQRDIHIRANRITAFMQVLHDGGAIYTQAQSPGSDVAENYISYRGAGDGNGIYLDERSRNYTICGNVVWDEPSLPEGRWLSTWSSWSGDLDIYDNWSDDRRQELHNPGTTKHFHGNHLALTAMPVEAMAIAEASGAQGGQQAGTDCLQQQNPVKPQTYPTPTNQTK